MDDGGGMTKQGWPRWLKVVAGVWSCSVVLFIVIGIVTSEEQPAPAAPAQEVPWYVGGTLHNVPPQEWRSASEENRLATAADWGATWALQKSGGEGSMAASEMVDGVPSEQREQTLIDLRRVAEDLVVCVDTAYSEEDGGVGDMSGAVAALCAILMYPDE